VVAAFQELRPFLAPGAPVVLLTNGMGLYEQLATLHPPAQLFIGTTTEAAWRDTDGVIVHAGRGQTLVGQVGVATGPGWCQELADRLDRFSWEPEIEQNLWRKLLINCAINPLTAIHNCRNGELLENEAWLNQAMAVCDEFAAVARSRGMPAIALQARETALAVMASTAANQSSMLQDIQHGRETEIDYITGWLCDQAQRLELPCPQNHALLQQVRSLSRNTGDKIKR
jgi:2-dehydropantoate 2-reductase